MEPAISRRNSVAAAVQTSSARAIARVAWSRRLNAKGSPARPQGQIETMTEHQRVSAPRPRYINGGKREWKSPIVKFFKDAENGPR